MDNELFLSLYQSNKDSAYYFRNGIPLEIPTYYKNILDNRYHKVSRIKKRLIYMLNKRKYLFFITFTFSYKYINKCDRTKRDLIKNCLNNIDDSLYMLNIDFGSKTEREHYHCILATDFNFNVDSYLKLTYPCFTKTERIRLDVDSISKLSKYINKLSNHACKDSTKNKRMYFNFKAYDIYNKIDLSKLGWIVYVMDKHNLHL